jgi:drug/metabolite transporter (DMT)-like permease
MNVGLLYTSASIYQMLRGSVVLCTGILSFFFLRRHLYAFQWMSLFVITLGIAVVGASPLLEDHAPADAFYVQENPERVLAGTFMVLLAQVFTSSQFIIEERLLAKYHLHPMEAIGYEGSFGLLFLFAMAPPAYFFIGQYNPDSWFNIPIGWSQVLSSPYIWGAGLGCIVSIAAFNGSALEVTKRLTATSRSTVDACRTISIWCVSLALGWESFRLLQVCGFVGGLINFALLLCPDLIRIAADSSPAIRNILIQRNHPTAKVPGTADSRRNLGRRQTTFARGRGRGKREKIR